MCVHECVCVCVCVDSTLQYISQYDQYTYMWTPNTLTSLTTSMAVAHKEDVMSAIASISHCSLILMTYIFA